MVSSPINLAKLFPEADEAGQNVLKQLELKYQPFMTLLELAEEFEAMDNEIRENLVLPQYVIEEAAIVPRIKPRMYSIINDPFSDGSDKGDQIELLFSLEKFEKNGKVQTGFCSRFLSLPQPENAAEIRCHMGPAYRVLSLPKVPEGQVAPVVMFA